MSSFRSPDVIERRNNAAAVKKAMLEKFRAVAEDPALAEEQRAKRMAVAGARARRQAEREAAKKLRDAELAAEAARAAELAAQAQTPGGKRIGCGADRGRKGRTSSGAGGREKGRAGCPLRGPQGGQKGTPARFLIKFCLQKVSEEIP